MVPGQLLHDWMRRPDSRCSNPWRLGAVIVLTLLCASCRSAERPTPLPPVVEQPLESFDVSVPWVDSISVKVDPPRIVAEFRLFDQAGLPISGLQASDVDVRFPAYTSPGVQWSGEPAGGRGPGFGEWGGPQKDGVPLRCGRRVVEFAPVIPDPDRVLAHIAFLAVGAPRPDRLPVVDPNGVAFLTDLARRLSEKLSVSWACLIVRNEAGPEESALAESWTTDPAALRTALSELRWSPPASISSWSRARSFDQILLSTADEMATLPHDTERSIVISLAADPLFEPLESITLDRLRELGIPIYLLWGGTGEALNKTRLPDALETRGRVIRVGDYGDEREPGPGEARLDDLVTEISRRTQVWAGGTYRLELCDDVLDPAFVQREYGVHCRTLGGVVSFELPVGLDPRQVQSLKDGDIASTVEHLERASPESFHAALSATLPRYPLSDLSPVTEAARRRALTWARGGRASEARSVMQGIEALFAGDPQWRSRLREGYTRIGDGFVSEGNHLEAIGSYQVAIQCGETRELQGIYESMLASQLAVLDYAGARVSADWIHDHGRIEPSKMGGFLATLARVHAASLQFRRALTVARDGLIEAKPGDRVWEDAILLVKAPWFTGAARSIAEALPGQAGQAAFERLTAELVKAPDLRWAALLEPSGRARLAVGPEVEAGLTLARLAPWAEVAPGAVTSPIFLQPPKSAAAEAVVLVPLGSGKGHAVLAVCYDAFLNWEERDASAATQRNPADDLAWGAFAETVAERVGAVMMRTVGLCASDEMPSEEAVARVARKYASLLVDDHSRYEIAVARGEDEDDPPVVHHYPSDLPEMLIRDRQANLTPDYLSREVTLEGRRIRERGIAFYRGREWLGFLRVGFTL